LIPQSLEIRVDRKTGEVQGGWKDIEKMLTPLEAVTRLAQLNAEDAKGEVKK
jgi:hypothetical protein